jgi:hypothetical protein
MRTSTYAIPFEVIQLTAYHKGIMLSTTCNPLKTQRNLMPPPQVENRQITYRKSITKKFDNKTNNLRDMSEGSKDDYSTLADRGVKRFFSGSIITSTYTPNRFKGLSNCLKLLAFFHDLKQVGKLVESASMRQCRAFRLEKAKDKVFKQFGR